MSRKKRIIDPPESFKKEGRDSTVYYTMIAEMIGKKFMHDDYACHAGWLLVQIAVNNPNNP